MQVELTQAEILEKLQTNKTFLAGFVIDNNPEAVIDNLRQMGYQITEPDEAFEIVVQLSDSGKIEEVTQALNVPYLDGAENYTGGFAMQLDELRSKTVASQSSQQSGSPRPLQLQLGAILGVIGAVGDAIWGSGGSSSDGTDQDAQAQAAAAQAQAQAAAAEAKAKTTQTVIIGAVITVIVIAIAYFATRKSE